MSSNERQGRQGAEHKARCATCNPEGVEGLPMYCSEDCAYIGEAGDMPAVWPVATDLRWSR